MYVAVLNCSPQDLKLGSALLEASGFAARITSSRVSSGRIAFVLCSVDKRPPGICRLQLTEWTGGPSAYRAPALVSTGVVYFAGSRYVDASRNVMAHGDARKEK